jgi:hypothetical protein
LLGTVVVFAGVVGLSLGLVGVTCPWAGVVAVVVGVGVGVALVIVVVAGGVVLVAPPQPAPSAAPAQTMSEQISDLNMTLFAQIKGLRGGGLRQAISSPKGEQGSQGAPARSKGATAR